MSGSNDKPFFVGEARVKYKRLKSLLARAGNPTLPEELEKAVIAFDENNSRSSSDYFNETLRISEEAICLPEELKPELRQIVSWYENQELFGTEEAKAQLSADRIHLCC